MKNSIQKIDKKRCVVFFDFDNTVTAVDVLDDMIERFSTDNRWKELEARWKKGEIGSRKCLEGQLEGIRITRKFLNEYLGSIRLDPYFKLLVNFIRHREIRAYIISDNFDYFLKTVLKHNNLCYFKTFCNSIRLKNRAFFPSFPFPNDSCGLCGHCKKRTLLGRLHHDDFCIYIGDGRSDICP
ncbi:MAG: MtnX-like HAD-IB family phosphatase, partial [Candidatus Omnitrophica bacterium]|nr:MtnX-like HAD-IB family phosphatase [Candidatus Omnitrophota bacterium]